MDRYASFASESIHVFQSAQVMQMREIAEANEERKRYRVCAHRSVDEELQEMYICAKDEGYVIPQMHPDTAETHFIIEGSIATIIFDDDGNIRDAVVLNRENGALSCRVGKGIFHMDFFLTPWVTFLEFKKGPFTAMSNVNAPWAPAKDDIEKVAAFMDMVTNIVNTELGTVPVRRY